MGKVLDVVHELRKHKDTALHFTIEKIVTEHVGNLDDGEETRVSPAAEFQAFDILLGVYGRRKYSTYGPVETQFEYFKVRRAQNFLLIPASYMFVEKWNIGNYRKDIKCRVKSISDRSSFTFGLASNCEISSVCNYSQAIKDAGHARGKFLEDYGCIYDFTAFAVTGDIDRLLRDMVSLW